jgi:hypothetical protein
MGGGGGGGGGGFTTPSFLLQALINMRNKNPRKILAYLISIVSGFNIQ